MIQNTEMVTKKIDHVFILFIRNKRNDIEYRDGDEGMIQNTEMMKKIDHILILLIRGRKHNIIAYVADSSGILAYYKIFRML